ncbi:hypothetical protein EMPS_04909 [Entomortierella parvispora]|uniref:Metal homeostatis protein bsd2 n=1 Tax=Entomortierella parvispora TaxID=205924 RepID=A0A9P3LVU2_9FUNG|nr:hypothetical protein EMPS_04909 [Entomortierella parvispora]
MSRNHSYAQIPLSEAQEGASSSSSGPLSTLSRIPSSLSNSHGGSSGSYARVNAEDALDDRDHDDDDDEVTNENDMMLRPMGRQSHSEITVAQDDNVTPQPTEAAPQTTQQQLRTQLSNFRPPHFPVAAGARRVIQSTMDGVFSNLSARPRVERPHQEELPPPYKAAALDQSPAYYEATAPSPYGDDEILVDGLPVGGFYGFAWNMIISMSFQFVGFFLTYLLHTSHATRSGSKMGLGITFISMGTQMMSGKAPGSDVSPEEDSDTGYMGNTGESVKSVQEYIWLSYVMLFMGAVIMLHSGVEFLRAKRAEMIIIAAAASSSEAMAAAESTAAGEASSSGTSSASVPPLTQSEINALHASAV